MQVLSQVYTFLLSHLGCNKIDNCTYIHDERYAGVPVPPNYVPPHQTAPPPSSNPIGGYQQGVYNNSQPYINRPPAPMNPSSTLINMQIIQCLQLTVILAITPTMALALQTTLQVDPLTFQQEYPTLVVVQVAIIRVAIRATVAVDLVIQEEIRPITQETARIITLIHLVATMEVETTTMATMSEPIALAKEEVMALLRKEAFQV